MNFCERTANQGLVIGLPEGIDRRRTYIYKGIGWVPRVGAVVPYCQGTGDGYGAERLGYWINYRHHGVVIASGTAQILNAEATQRDGAAVWIDVVWVTYRPCRDYADYRTTTSEWDRS